MADPSFEERTRVQTQDTGQFQQDTFDRQQQQQQQAVVQQPPSTVPTQEDIDDNRSEDSYYAETCVEKGSPVDNKTGPSGTDTPQPLPMDEKKQPVDAGINIPPPPPAVSDVESQAAFPPRPPYWKRLITNKTFQMIAAALLAVTIGLIVAATVEKVPDEAKAFLALPGYMWLRAVKAAGKYTSYVHQYVDSLLTHK